MYKKSIFLLSVFLLAICANMHAAPKAPPEPLSEIQQRIRNGSPTIIVLSGGETISAEPQFLCVTAEKVLYKYGGLKGAENGRTILVGNKHPATLLLQAAPGMSATIISAPTIEVETLLSQIQVKDDGRRDVGETPWHALAEALRAAPYSPRLSVSWHDELLDAHDSSSIIYDRRTKNLFTWQSYTSMDMSGTTYQGTERGVTETNIETRVPTWIRDAISKEQALK